MRSSFSILGLCLFSCGLASATEVRWWMSSEDGAASLSEQPALRWSAETLSQPADIVLDASKTYQSILGLGASFEHSTCYNLSQLSEEKKTETLRKLVHPKDGIGMSLMRLCIGTSDFTGDPWYSYNDMPAGESDPELKNFSIEKDRAYLLPIIKQAQAIHPDLKFFASVWSPPGWMKTNDSMLAGRLKPEYYGVFSEYLVKFVQAYAAEGIPVLAITPQNEPHFPNPAYPTTGYRAEAMLELIRDHLGPLFEKELPDTEIWCWDHNWNEPEFPTTILSDEKAYGYVDGTAFHLYEGKPEAQTALKEAFPEKPIYFTEGSTFRTRGAVQIIDILRNWARSYNAWVVMLDEDRKPNNGPHNASQTCIELLRDGTVRYNFDYFMYGQFMKFIRPGAVRLDSTPGSIRFANVAFRNESGDTVLVVANASSEAREFIVSHGGGHYRAEIPKRTVATFTWDTE